MQKISILSNYALALTNFKRNLLEAQENKSKLRFIMIEKTWQHIALTLHSLNAQLVTTIFCLSLSRNPVFVFSKQEIAVKCFFFFFNFKFKLVYSATTGGF